jgi:hypothetical protein
MKITAKCREDESQALPGNSGKYFVKFQDMTAIYRVTHDGWTPQQAYAEMKRFGFDGALTTLKEFFFDYARHSATRTTGPAPGGLSR